MSRLNQLFKEELLCTNVGLKVFYDAIVDQGTKCVQIEWKPPADGDEKLLRILEWLEEE